MQMDTDSMYLALSTKMLEKAVPPELPAGFENANYCYTLLEGMLVSHCKFTTNNLFGRLGAWL